VRDFAERKGSTLSKKKLTVVWGGSLPDPAQVEYVAVGMERETPKEGRVRGAPSSHRKFTCFSRMLREAGKACPLLE